MPYSVVVHVINEDAISGQIERLPEPTDQVLIMTDVRLRDGRDVSYILPETTRVVFPWTRIHCVEILPSGEEEEIVSFVRE